MTCGNPICKYEFCWLCMNEAVPNHYDYGPCAGKQFFDPDSFSYWLEQNYPCLSCIYNTIVNIFAFIAFIISFMIAPAIGLTFISYSVVYEDDDLNFVHSYRKIKKFLAFMIFVCIGLSCQSLVYILWSILFSIIGILISALIASILLTIVSTIIKLILCIDNNPPNNNDVIELALQNNNNENNEINNNNNNEV